MHALRRRVVLVALGISMAAMTALHVVQPELDPLQQPVSFYIAGAHGWLLAVALGAFGIAPLVLEPAIGGPSRPGLKCVLTLCGAALLLTSLLRSDRWFPWERTPTLSGLVHAGAAMIAPVLLLIAMVLFVRPSAPGPRAPPVWLVGLFLAALIGCGLSLAIGLSRDGPPPWIGLFERTLAGAAVAWVAAVAWPAREPTGRQRR
jgi:hypothetical protein